MLVALEIAFRFPPNLKRPCKFLGTKPPYHISQSAMSLSEPVLGGTRVASL